MSTGSAQRPKTMLDTVKQFGTAGTAGCFGWCIVHPFNTAAIQLNLATGTNQSFYGLLKGKASEGKLLSLYEGLGAGVAKQVVYATSRMGIFEVIRDEIAKYRETDIYSRLFAGSLSGGIAACLSIPIEVTLVRISNDSTQPPELRRNYTGIANAFTRIAKEEGAKTFFSGLFPFANRAMLVGASQG